MNAYEFMTGSPWLAFFIALIIAGVVKAPFRLVKRWIRHLNIRQHGWPPIHCDADGDAVTDDDEE